MGGIMERGCCHSCIQRAHDAPRESCLHTRGAACGLVPSLALSHTSPTHGLCVLILGYIFAPISVEIVTWHMNSCSLTRLSNTFIVYFDSFIYDYRRVYLYLANVLLTNTKNEGEISSN